MLSYEMLTKPYLEVKRFRAFMNMNLSQQCDIRFKSCEDKKGLIIISNYTIVKRKNNIPKVVITTVIK